ncbi:hypothetical protein TrLO_g3881 [Triparma laevis f. longispina]|uniref:Ion transport domain-containing protein n=1 Tax=Triparma laevis f. longispina TaxID=1714387 RepID=A0A9W7EAX0_9STRA|nr:hypothetical protein TrLO_g3881 [Triparma laevis f. longispina]
MDNSPKQSLNRESSITDVWLGGGDPMLKRMSKKHNSKKDYKDSTPKPSAVVQSPAHPDNEEARSSQVTYYPPTGLDDEQMSRDRTKTKEDIATESQYCHDIPGLQDPNKCRALLISPDESEIWIADGDDDKQQGGLHVLQLADGKEVAKFAFHESICCLAFPYDSEDPASAANKKPTMIYASTGEGSIIAFSNEDEVTPTDKKLRTTVKLKNGKEDERYYDEPLQRFGTKQARGSDEDERRAHEGRVYDITVTHDGKFLISVSEDKFIKVWSLQDPENPPGTPDQVFVQGDKIYSTDSLSTKAYENKGSTWWQPTPKLKRRGGIGGIVNRDKAKLPSRPKYMFCSGNRYGDIFFYYLRGRTTKKDGKDLPKNLISTIGNATGVIKTGKTKLTINKIDDKIEWDEITEKKADEEPSTKRIMKNAHKKSLYSLIFSEDGSRLYSGAYDTFIKIWDTASLNCLQTLVRHKHVVCTLALHGDFLCSGSYDKSIKLWHIETGTEVRTITGTVTQKDESAKNSSENPEVHRESAKAVHLDRVNEVVFFKNGTNIISASTDRTVKRWNIAMNQEDARVLREWAFQDETYGANELIESMSVAKNSPKKVIVTGGGFMKKNGNTVVHKHGTEVSTSLGSDFESDLVGKSRHTDQVEDVVVSDDGTVALSIANDKQVIYWDLTKVVGNPPIPSGEEAFVRKYDTKNRGHSVAITKDKKRFYAGVGEGILQEWNCDDNSNYVREYTDTNVKKGRAHKGWVMSIKLTKDNKKMVTGSHSSEVKIWDTALDPSPEEPQEPRLLFNLGKGNDENGIPILNGHQAPVKDIKITPDDLKVASGSEDKTIKIWDILTGFLLATLEGHEAEVTSISIRSRGDYLASGSKDKTWKLWTLDTDDNERAYKLVYTSSQGEGSLMPKACVAFSADDACLLSGSTDPERADIFSSEKISMIFYHLPSVVQECMFKNDCSKEDEGHPKKFSKGDKDKKSKGEGNEAGPTQHEHHLKNLLHLAASDGRSNFIKSSIFYDSKTEAEKAKTDEKQKIALKALLMKDSNSNLPIDCAIDFENGATVDVILQGFTRLLSQDFAKPFHEDQSSQEQHPLELFPLESLCEALEMFPEEGLNFVSRLELVNGGDFLVQKGVKRFVLPKTNRLIVGSDQRIPQGFWKRTVGPGTKLYKAVQKEKNQKKGVLSSVLRFLELMFCCFTAIIFIFRPIEPDKNEDSDPEKFVRRNLQEDGTQVRNRSETAENREVLEIAEAEEEKKYKDKDQVKKEEANLRKNEYGNPVAGRFVPIKGVAAQGSKFLEQLAKAANKAVKYKAFENEVVRSVIEHKWDKFAKKMFLKHMYLYIIMVLCMTFDAFLNKTLTNGTNWKCVFNNGLEICDKTRDDKMGLESLEDWMLLWRLPMLIAIILWARFCWHEVKQIFNTSLREHFEDIWNILDFSSLSLMFLAYLFRVLYWFDHMGPTYTTVVLSFALPLTWLNMLYFLQGFDESGRLVRMILGIVQGTKFFLLILVVCMVGFAAGFFVLYENQDADTLRNGSARVEHMSPTMSIFSSYTLMLGEFDVENFPETSSGEFFSVILLFTVFTFFINIIMLNLLIAIMGDIFDKFEEMLTTNNAEWFPTWLQVLTPLHQSDNNADNVHDEWTGRVQKVTNRVDKLGEKIEDTRTDNEAFKEAQEKFREDVNHFMMEMRREFSSSLSS